MVVSVTIFCSLAKKWVFVIVFVCKLTLPILVEVEWVNSMFRGFRILARPEVVGSYILWSVWLGLSLVPVLPRDAIVRLPDPADVPLAVSPREGLGNGSNRIMATDS